MAPPTFTKARGSSTGRKRSTAPAFAYKSAKKRMFVSISLFKRARTTTSFLQVDGSTDQRKAPTMCNRRHRHTEKCDLELARDCWTKVRPSFSPTQAGDEACFNALIVAGVPRRGLVRAGLAGPFYA